MSTGKITTRLFRKWSQFMTVIVSIGFIIKQINQNYMSRDISFDIGRTMAFKNSNSSQIICDLWELNNKNDGHGWGVLDESKLKACNKPIKKSFALLLSVNIYNLKSYVLRRIWINTNPLINKEPFLFTKSVKSIAIQHIIVMSSIKAQMMHWWFI